MSDPCSCILKTYCSKNSDSENLLFRNAEYSNTIITTITRHMPISLKFLNPINKNLNAFFKVIEFDFLN